jgi:predicted small metal-binding protein
MEESKLAYSITCVDAGEDCSFACTSPTEDELMQHIQMHASVGHPGMDLTAEKISQVKSVIRTS